ncbi:MAG TPA: methylated-DNA--[protein]-cysteine S-methyltransferase [Usitatibacter sp.]|nr:methylated-DNA--[protein]-cysteine S-methyltransferase [Usitatibacter sp.]
MIRYARIPTPAGTLFAASTEGAITGIYFENQQYFPEITAKWQEDANDPVLRECARQIDEYFDGKRTEFDLPLAPAGTDFQQRVWNEIARIPYGKTITYAELARRAGAEGSARAAGAATGRNPITLVVPCHRVVGSDGSLTGYAGGLPRKTRLLEIEGVLQGSLV